MDVSFMLISRAASGPSGAAAEAMAPVARPRDEARTAMTTTMVTSSMGSMRDRRNGFFIVSPRGSAAFA
jgi:hypothetical protein